MLRLSGQRHSGVTSMPSIVLKFRKGEIVYAQGDPAADWFEVISGTVRTCHLHVNGHRQLTGFYYQGDVFGIETGVHQSSAEAVTDVRLRRVYRALGDQPCVSERRRAVVDSDALQVALHNARDCIFLLGHRTAPQRMAAFLLATSRRIGSNSKFQLPMSRSDIADHLGLTIHTVSRTLSDLVRKGFIVLQGPQTVIIADRERLGELAGLEYEDPLPKAYAASIATSYANTNNITQVAG
jgi:CRP/FNR family transcriptional regulator, nitrogen fixation regulation protein